MKPRPGYLFVEVTVAQARAALSLLDQEPFDDQRLLARAFPGTSDGQRLRQRDCAMRLADAIERAFDERARRGRPW